MTPEPTEPSAATQPLATNVTPPASTPPDASTSARAEQGGRRVLASAAIIAVGTLLGSILGFVRITVLNVLFYGARGVASGAFVIALRPIQQINDLLVGGSVSGALIPTFVDYSAPEQREELRRVYSTVVNLVLLLMAGAALLLIVVAPLFVPLETPKFTAQGQQLTVLLVRITAFSLFGLGLYAVTSALLYALKEVVYPAFATGVYHVGVVVCGVAALLIFARAGGVSPAALLDHTATGAAAEQARLLGARGLAVGAAVGAAGECLVLLPGLRKVRANWRPVLDLQHPAVRQIVRLYGPIAAGLLISVLYQNIDVALIGRTPGGAEANATALQSGTVLVQFPIGLVAAALSFAVLPPLTAAATRADLPDFKRTLRLGIRLGLLLMVPAMVGLLLLRVPIVALLFQHGTCGAGCTVRNALALQNYVFELPFIALDQLLIAAFYARKNTLTPNIVGVVAIAFYLVVAVPFGTSVGMPALAFGDTAKNTGHALLLFALLTLAIGDLGLRDLLSGTLRIVLAAGVMAAICWAGVTLLPAQFPALFSTQTFAGRGLTLLVVGGSGALAYVGLVIALRVEEVRLLVGIVAARFGRVRRG